MNRCDKNIIVFKKIYKYFAGDDKVEKYNVTKVILVSGKHYYALDNYRDTSGNKNVAIIRIENLCPFPIHELLEEIAKYKHAKSKYKNVTVFDTN